MGTLKIFVAKVIIKVFLLLVAFYMFFFSRKKREKYAYLFKLGMA